MDEDNDNDYIASEEGCLISLIMFILSRGGGQCLS